MMPDWMGTGHIDELAEHIAHRIVYGQDSE